MWYGDLDFRIQIVLVPPKARIAKDICEVLLSLTRIS